MAENGNGEKGKWCDPEEFLDNIERWNNLRLMKELMGDKRFYDQFPEMKGIEPLLRSRLEEQRDTLRKEMRR